MRDEDVCRYLAWEPPTSIDDTLRLVREAKQLMARGQSIVYAQVWNVTGRAIGSTRLLDVRPADRQVEIGATFLDREFWRTPANTESKYLFLQHCFERPRRAEDGRAQRPFAGSDRPPGRGARGRAPPAHARERVSARHRVLLDPRRGVAGGEGTVTGSARGRLSAARPTYGRESPRSAARRRRRWPHPREQAATGSSSPSSPRPSTAPGLRPFRLSCR